MKAALVLVPKIFKPISRQAYYDVCRKMIKDEGFVVINVPFYEDFLNIYKTQYISEIEPIIDSIFIFTDFGIDKLLDAVGKKFPDKIVYKSFPENEIPVVKDTLEFILEETVVRARNFFHIDASFELFRTKSRKREIVLARDFFFKRAKDKTKASLAQIGFMVFKDHATVLHGIKKVNTEVGLIDDYNAFWGELKKDKTPFTPDEKSVKAEMNMRTAPHSTSPYQDIRPSNNREYTGYRPHQL